MWTDRTCESGVGGFDQSPVEPSIAGGVVVYQAELSFFHSLQSTMILSKM